MKKKKCIITGANGVIGKYISNYLKKRNWKIIKISSKKRKGCIFYKLNSSIKFNIDKIKKADVLIHCAYDFKIRSWHEIKKININGSEKIFNLAKSASIKKIINVSSLSSFNKAESNYGKAKFQIEKIGKKYNVINLRCGLIKSKDSKLYSKIYSLSKKIFIFPLIGKGDQKLHLLKLNDLAKFILRIESYDKKLSSNTFYVANPNFILFKNLILSINKKKIFIYIPHFVIKLILKFFDKIYFKMGFSYDNYLGLVNYNKNMNFKNYLIYSKSDKK